MGNNKIHTGVYAMPAHSVPSGAEFHPDREHQMTRSMLAVAAVAFGVTAVMAQSDPLSQRKSLMKGNGQQLGTLNKMARGEEPFDGAKINAAFTQWSETAQKLPGLFPEPPKSGEDTRALPKIWEAKSDFEAKIAAFSKVITDNKDNAKTVDELKVAVPLIGKACGNCHEPYRKPAPQQQPAPR
jgi:cytochrome c556